MQEKQRALAIDRDNNTTQPSEPSDRTQVRGFGRPADVEIETFSRWKWIPIGQLKS